MGERGTYTSVTTMIHGLFSHFDADEIIDKMMRSKNWKDPNYKYYGMTREEIKAMWNKKKNESAGAGTNMHYDIECYWNGLEVVNESLEYQYFKEFVRDFPDLKPYRTEWMVYYEDVKLSGSIDMIFENPDGTIQIYDWKRCQEIQYDNAFGKNAIAKCIQHLPDTNFWHYSLQLNTYKKILEDKYGKKVTDMYLICIHPDNPYKKYDRIQVPVLEAELNDLFDMLKEKVAAKKAQTRPRLLMTIPPI